MYTLYCSFPSLTSLCLLSASSGSSALSVNSSISGWTFAYRSGFHECRVCFYDLHEVTAHCIHTLSLYVLPNSCTDFKSTAPFRPFLPSLERLLRQHLRIQQKQIPRMTMPNTVQKKLCIQIQVD